MSALPPIKIKEKNEGKFTTSANKKGEGIQEYAHQVMSNENASATERRRANFAINAKHWSHKGK